MTTDEAMALAALVVAVLVGVDLWRSRRAAETKETT